MEGSMLQTLLALKSYYPSALILHTGHIKVLSSLRIQLKFQPQSATKRGIG